MKGQEITFIASAATEDQFPDHRRWEIALAGRSNVGKSSLINCLAGRKEVARTSQTPGRTRTLNFYGIGHDACLVDMPGYGYAKVAQRERERWARVIETYLWNRRQLVGIIQVVDVRHAPTELDETMAAWIRERSLPAVAVATKADKIARGRWQGRADAISRGLGLPVIIFSAVTGTGVRELTAWIRDVFEAARSSHGGRGA